MPDSAVPYRILHLEDDAIDAELIQSTLEAEWRTSDIVLARDRAAYENAIAGSRFDLILCDYNLPAYDGLQALTLARETQPDAPVIVITGTLSEDEAVECVKAGATDYVLKSRLQRLAPCVARALREAAEQRERRQAEAALRLSEERLQLALEAAEVSVWEYDLASGRVAFSRQLGPMLGYEYDEVPAGIDAWEALTHTADVKRLRVAVVKHYRGEIPHIELDYRVRARNGEWRWLQTRGRIVARDAAGRPQRMSGTHRDITQRRREDEMMRLQELAIDAATNAIIIVDARAADYPIIHVNRAFETITGYAAQEVIGRNCRFLQGADRDQPDLERLREAIALGGEASVVLRNYRKDGSLFWNSVRISPLRSPHGVLTHFVGIHTDVTELKSYEVELEHRANHDGLTGLANKNLLHDRLDRAIAMAGRMRRKFALLYLDLDRFKTVNDSLGHAAGDALLRSVAARLTGCVRESDTVARVSGDEFAVILLELDQVEAVFAIAEKILHEIRQPVTIDGEALSTSASVGVCIYPDDGTSGDVLLKHADSAMYRAKYGGRYQIGLYAHK